MPLSDTACRTAKADSKAKKLTDGGGLYLYVTPGGTKSWRLDYKVAGKRKTLTIGRYPEVSLAAARRERERAKAQIRIGRDPSGRTGTTFGDLARSWYDANRANWKTSYSARLWSRLDEHVLPELGAIEISDLDPRDILRTLRKVEDGGSIYTAKRLNQIIGAIFRFAIAEGVIKSNPAPELKDALKSSPRVVHRAYLREDQMPDFFDRLARYREEQTRLALELVVRTFVRTNEIRFATWDEFKGDVWTIPGERMKMGLEHRVPLAEPVKLILDRLRDLADGNRWVLPGLFGRRARPISENTLIYAMHRLGYHRVATVHGFRRTASTILNESGLFHPDWIERQLAHVPHNAIRGVYNAAEYWPFRVKMMNWYSDRIDELKRSSPRPSDVTHLLI